MYQIGILPETDISVSSGSRKGSFGPSTLPQAFANLSLLYAGSNGSRLSTVAGPKQLPRLTP